jgi:hypothetical protein
MSIHFIYKTKVSRGSMKETKSQGIQHFIPGSPHGGENPAKTFSIIYFQYNAKTKTKTPKKNQY